MEQSKQKVFVFDKAELFFLFLFFVVMSITAFVLGMRLGKKQAELFLQPESSKTAKTVEIKSSHEETQEKKLEDEHAPAVAGHESGEQKAFVDKPAAATGEADMDEETFKKLQTEYQKINTNDMGHEAQADAPIVPPAEPATEAEQTEKPAAAVEQTPAANTAATPDSAFLNPDPSFIGKYTIQLGSYRTIAEAKNFAEGFLTRGYKPLIREVEVSGQGTWYRVSLGVFESISSANQYIQKEKALFGGYKKDQYFIKEIK